MPADRSERLRRWLRDSLGYEAVDLSLFETALTHRSADGPNNERLEFLGDAVLGLITAQYLFERFAEADEGSLSRLRASVVNGESLAQLAAGLSLGEHLTLGPGELKSGGFRRESILSDALEALCGALYVDGVEGELHAQVFRVTCEVEPLSLRASATGSSRRRAEQVAAARILEQIQADS